MSRPIFIYVSAKSVEKPEVREFVEYYLKHGSKLAKEVKYVPLTDADYKHALDNFSKKKTGTAFGGHSEVGVKVADLLKRDPKE
jgi:phosphate transport system substrate-binding protein